MNLSRKIMMSVALAIVFTVVSEASAQSSNLQIKGPRDSQNQFSGAIYGPIDASDTLWRIASRYRQNRDLSVYQVMIAIYELNPDAFEQGNINYLVDGAVLNLPSERYIARIDADDARKRTEAFNQAAGSSSSAANEPTNIKPPGDLVKKADLDEKTSQIEQKLSRIDQQQIEQFDLLRQQFAASIDNVQALIDENRKVFERLDAVNEDINDLRSKVDEQVQPQIDQQVALLQQTLDLINQREAREKAEQESSLANLLSSPAAIIGGSSLLTLLLLGGLVMWLVKRKKNADAPPVLTESQVAPATQTAATQAPMDDLSDALMDDLAAPDADDDLFNDDELLDDVLSEELEESLDDAVESELESYADLSDEMLVPDLDDDDDSLFEDDDELLQELDATDDDALEGIDLSDDEDIDLSDALEDDIDDALASELEDAGELDGDSLDELFEEDELSEIDSDIAAELAADDIEAAMDEQLDEELAESEDINSLLDEEAEQSFSPVEAEEEKPEISIDELLEEPEKKSEVPANIDVDVATGVSSQMLEQLGDEVAAQNEALDRVTDEILSELDQIEMMQGFVDEDDDEEDLLIDDPEPADPVQAQHDIQTLDEFAADLDDIDVDDVTELDDPLSDELLAELEAETADDEEFDVSTAENSDDEEVVDDPLTDELLAELEAETADDEEFDVSTAENSDDEEVVDDPLTDELLAELEAETADDEELEVNAADDLGDEEAVDDPLTDELLAELEAETADNEELEVNAADDLDDEEAVDDPLTDELLAELEAETAGDEELDASATDDSTDEALDDEEDALTDELLAELEAETEEDSEDSLNDGLSDELLAEFEADEESSLEPEFTPDTEEAYLASEQDGISDEETEAATEELLDVFDTDSSVDEPELEIDEAPDEDNFELDDIPSLGDEASTSSNEFDDALLAEEFDEFSLDDAEEETTQSTEPDFALADGDDELDDMPGLGDWLNEDKDQDSLVLEEIEGADFDELLESIDSEVEGKPELKLDNPDLDLDALFTEPEPPTESEDFVDVDTLLAESESDDGSNVDDAELNLNVDLEGYTGISNDDFNVDVDDGGAQAANLDLAIAYIEMDDSDAAKELLLQVIEQGSDEQQKEAKELLENLS
ncbi:FimV/HubP family polar landmark protein [Alteromonas flava]|uniref:FimV/HubP family polar landmark protein n=1 Tax=Alteromonas flava TaxID=2048003 RepID=UPI000C28809A|nr:FimV/HubP family polar landmark protein [Alteromonas flava]